MNSNSGPERANTRQLTINAAGLLLLFGWACYVLLTWLVSRYLPEIRGNAGAVVGAGYLIAVGGLLAFMATQSVQSGRHLTYQSTIDRSTAPVRFWLLTWSMGGIGTALLGAGIYALLKTLLTTLS